MHKHTGLLCLVALGLTVAGCSRETNIGRSFYSEAGSDIQSADFGRSVASNAAIQSGEAGYVIDLNRRFTSEVPATVNFAFNSSQLDGEAQAILARQATWIRQFPEVRFKVFGFTDLVGSEGYNYALGHRRAQAVVSFLVSQGVSRSRLEAVVSFGKTRPLIDVSTPERRNRRAVTEVTGFVENNPLVLNGKYAAIVFREYVNSAIPKQTTSEVTEGSAAAGTE